MTQSNLKCALQTNDEVQQVLQMKQEEGKKSSFILNHHNEESSSCMNKPASIILSCSTSDTTTENHHPTTPFLFGGVNIISNARNVEVYEQTTLDGNKHGNADYNYLTTVRGTLLEADDNNVAQADNNNNNTNKPHDDKQNMEWYQCIITHPNGGPTEVSSIKFKLLSLRPARASEARVRQLVLKGRLPDVEAVSTNTSSTACTNQVKVDASNANDYRADDMGAALAAMSMTARATEERILHHVDAQMAALNMKMGEMSVQLLEQSRIIMEQNRMLMEQQILLREQSSIIQTIQAEQRSCLATSCTSALNFGGGDNDIFADDASFKSDSGPMIVDQNVAVLVEDGGDSTIVVVDATTIGDDNASCSSTSKGANSNYYYERKCTSNDEECAGK